MVQCARERDGREIRGREAIMYLSRKREARLFLKLTASLATEGEEKRVKEAYLPEKGKNALYSKVEGGKIDPLRFLVP